MNSAGLSARHVTIIVATYFEGQVQSEIAPLLGITRQRVSQLLIEALQLLKAAGLPTPRKRPRVNRIRCMTDIGIWMGDRGGNGEAR